MSRRLTFFGILVACLAIVLSGCGRKTGLDKPSVARAEAQGEKAPETEPVEEDRKFILDGLIE